VAGIHAGPGTTLDAGIFGQLLLGQLEAALGHHHHRAVARHQLGHPVDRPLKEAAVAMQGRELLGHLPAMQGLGERRQARPLARRQYD
jgi:hypothetical protein